MVELSPEQLAQRASDLNLVDRRQLESIWGELGSHNVSLSEMQRVLLGRGILTNYQFDRLARGERSGFFYGNYKVLYLVGTGSFARVYRAVHTESGQIVALKILRRRFSETPLQTEQFLREGRMGSKLRHPNIVPIFEVFSVKRTYLLVMEFVEGQNLREFLRARKKLSFSDSVNIAIDVTAGMAHAADRGITHRDLKLSNVLISSSGRAQLVDFGLAAAATGDGDDEEIINPRTIDYAGLERTTNVRKDDPRTDIFFNGCMFYQMLCGVAPLSETRDRLKRTSHTRFQEIKPLQEVDPELPIRLAMIVNKSMELNPEKRFQSQAEMLFELKNVQTRIKEGNLDRDEIVVDTPKTHTGPPKTVMVVESNPKMQDFFRAQLKKEGYRVLVMRSPSLAAKRLDGEPGVVDCVVFSCLGLGSEGLEAFNRLGTNGTTHQLPAILLLNKRQTEWESNASLSDHRIAVTMPVKMRKFRETLDQLLCS